MRRCLLVLLLALIVCPAGALAAPGDPAIQALDPTEGEQVAANVDGVTVSFTCPEYTMAYATEIFPPEIGTAADYEAAFSTSASQGPDGRLAVTTATGTVIERGPQRGVCDARLGVNDYPPPQATPGTYYWQAWRDCPVCDGGFEVGPVVRFVIRAAGKAVLKAPAKAYAGYPFVVTAAYGGAGGQTRVQRRIGKRWRTLANLSSNGAPIVKLPRGPQRLRTRVDVGGDTVTSRVVTVRVLKPRGWSTGARDDGSYRDPDRPSVRLRVAGKGRRITGLSADVPTLCGDLTSPTGTTPNIATVTLPPVRIAPDGRFAVSGTVKGGQTVRFTGRLAKRRLRDARLATDQGNCAGSIAVTARRRAG